MRTLALPSIGAGITAGVFLGAMHLFFVSPLIIEAEKYELAEAPHMSDTPEALHDSRAHDHEAQERSPFKRSLFTLVGTVNTGAAFGLFSGIAVMFLSRWDVQLNWKLVVGLGAAGFLTFNGLPALGLPPPLPGMPEADLSDRQGWWVLVAISSTAGFVTLGLGLKLHLSHTATKRSQYFIAYVAAAMLFVTPFLVGPPVQVPDSSFVPQELHRRFVTRALLTSALFWIVLETILVRWSRIALCAASSSDRVADA